ncbi:MAG: bifunctional transaldolase/phosoglucose isomerase [Myxococcales bacterium]|nr:bifunctional transaldolase/phosoglucose isomerase [Myxococcales bacterium]
MARAHGVRRLWARDASLWTGEDEGRWLDWLGVAEDERDTIEAAAPFFKDTGRRFTHAVVLGMGGSSLCPDVLSRIFEPASGCPRLLVLDSTDPAQVRAVEAQIDVGETLFIVSSKSGSTLEPNILKDYFLDRVRSAVGEGDAGARFVCVTDPGSPLEEVVRSEGFARTFFGVPGIGGRYSALSSFGMVPAAIMGLDVPAFLDRTELMVHACSAVVPPEENPGVLLGVVLGTLARAGRDKVTLIASPGIEPLGAWLEQLLAESTGKEGRGIIPVDREPLGPPEAYGADRLFAYLRLDGDADPAQDAAVEAIEAADHPVVRIDVAGREDLGQEFFRWEIATAVAGSILGINAFNQPDVEGSKVAAKELTDQYEETGALPDEEAFCEAGPFAFFADDDNARALAPARGGEPSARAVLKAHLERLGAGDYFAILAYIERSDPHERTLEAMRRAVRDAKRVATCVGFGPRFLHSTGQAYKGGPPSGVFLQVTYEPASDLAIPGHAFSFGVVEAAQARGDLRVLAERGRRLLRAHIRGDLEAGLAALRDAIDGALG